MLKRYLIIGGATIALGASYVAYWCSLRPPPTIQTNPAARQEKQAAVTQVAPQTDSTSGAETSNDPTARWSDQDKALINLGRKSVAEAIQFAESEYPPGQKRDDIFLFLIQELSKTDLNVVLKLMSHIEGKTTQRFVQDIVAQNWALTDAQALTRFVLGLRNPALRNDFCSKVVEVLAQKRRFEDAEKILMGMPFSSARSDAIRSIAGNFARSDPQGAIAWSERLPLEEDKSSARKAIINDLVLYQDGDGLLAVLPIALPNERPDILATIGRSLGSRGLSAADAAGLLGSDREMVLAGMAQSARFDDLPQIVAQAKTFENDYAKSALVSTYVARGFDADPEGIRRWVTSCAPELRPFAVRGLVDRWFDVDSTALSEWINALARGTDRDTALDALAHQLMHSDPAEAQNVAASIDNPAAREKMLKIVRMNSGK